MPRRVIVSARARRDLAALSPREQAAIRAALDRMTTEFGALDVKKLAGHGNEWRLRIGRWRVRLELDNATGEVYVNRVLARKDAYRD